MIRSLGKFPSTFSTSINFYSPCRNTYFHGHDLIASAKVNKNVGLRPIPVHNFSSCQLSKSMLCKMYNNFLLRLLFTFSALVNHAYTEHCVVRTQSDGGDDTPSLLDAFKRCGRDGSISLPDQIYHINQVMNTTDLSNCQIDLRGTLLVSATRSYRMSKKGA